MILATREIGSGSPLIILHGLFGSGDNWQAVAKLLSDSYRAILVDLPNHGASAHSDRFSYAEAAEWLSETITELDLGGVPLLGHSMGGKVAMQLALTRPGQVAALVVADIAPKRYPPFHRAIIDGMKRVSEAGAASRREADELLSEYVAEKPIRSFLLKNFVRGEDGAYRWRINLPVLDRDYDEVADWPGTPGRYDGPALFISGSKSPYVQAEDRELITQHFPAAVTEELSDAGHWMHAEQPQAFADRVREFLGRKLHAGTPR